MTFRVVSADSHPVSGGFVFSVGEGGPAAAESVSDLLGERRAGPATGVAFAATRALQYAAIALAIGCVAVLLLVWLPALAAEATPGGDWRAASDAFARRWRGLMIAAGVTGVASAAAALPLQAATAAGTSVWAALPDTRAVLDTRFGLVWALGGLAWLALLALSATRAGSVPAVRTATVGAAGIALARTGPWLAAIAVPLLWLACLPGLSGHASVQEPVAVLMPANVLHVAAAGAWIGGLAVLLIALPGATRRLAADRSRALAAALRRFSTLALVAVAALLAGGIVQSLLELSAVRDLVETAYGRAILVKSALVAVLIGCGALNRRRTIPAVSAAAAAGAAPGPSGIALRRILRAELALGVAALAVTGALAGYSPADAQEAGPFSASANLGPARAELTVEPARAGANEIHLYLFDRRDGSQWDATKELTARASLPDRGIAPIVLRARKAGPGHYLVAGAPLAPAGDWRLELAARVSDFDDYRTTFTVPIK